jgi:hypothetical protein
MGAVYSSKEHHKGWLRKKRWELHYGAVLLVCLSITHPYPVIAEQSVSNDLTSLIHHCPILGLYRHRANCICTKLVFRIMECLKSSHIRPPFVVS